MNTSIEIVWKKVDDAIAKQVIEYWKDAGFGTVPDERAQQIVVIARNENSKIMGISTTASVFVPSFKNKMYVFRASLHPEFRMPGLLEYITTESLKHLEATYKDNDPECIGVLAKIESPQLKKHRTIHARTGLNFVGFAEDGDPLRAYFFKRAKY